MTAIGTAIQEEVQRRYQPYHAYKDSGVEWLGKIPEHWQESKVKYLGRYINGYPFKPEDWSGDGLPIIRIQNLTNPETSFNRFAGEINPRCRVSSGDILISWSASLGIFIWSGEEDGWLNQHIFKVSPREDIVDRHFFIWLGDWFIRELQKEAHGSTMTHLTNNMFGGFRVELPPFSEQRAITAFLDRETARIDALVAKKQRLIELLQEQRTALITRAVTKGLDPTVPMKDSGVEWLGEIPEHWEVAKTWRLFSAISGGTPAKDEAAYWEGEIPWVSPKDMKRRFIETSEDMITELALAETGVKLIPNPSILVVVRGMILAHTFPVAITTAPVTINQDMKALQLRSNVAHSFIAWLFEGIGSALLGVVVENAAHGTKVIRMDKWHSVQLPVPPIDEQPVIAKHLDRETVQIDKLISRVRDAIKRLEELRTALISAAVTGKIDVREEFG